MNASECLRLPSPQAAGCLHDPLAGAALCPLPVAMATQAARQPRGWGRPWFPPCQHRLALNSQKSPCLRSASGIKVLGGSLPGALRLMNPRAESLDPKKAKHPGNS